MVNYWLTLPVPNNKEGAADVLLHVPAEEHTQMCSRLVLVFLYHQVQVLLLVLSVRCWC